LLHVAELIATNLYGRVRRLLLAPASEWAVIDGEPPEILAIYKNHIAPLVVFYALCGLIGGILFGVGFLRLRPPIMTLVGDTLVTVVIHLLMVQIFAVVVEALAPAFGAERNFGQAFKLAAYTPTPIWVGGVFTIFPQLNILSILAALYALYLLFTGLPQLMRPATGQAVLYVVAAVICAVGLFLVISWLLIAARFM